MKIFDNNSVDAVTTDPPYNLAFMGKAWDKSDITFKLELWEEVLRVLKPGGHALIFGGTRTYHRMACAVEDAGFEVRDTIHWTYGSGFPKSLDVGKAIDKCSGENLGVFAKLIKQRRLELKLSMKDVAKHFPSKTGGLTGCIWNWENDANIPTVNEYNKLIKILKLEGFKELKEIERDIISFEKRPWKGERRNISFLKNIALGNDNYQVKPITAPATEAAKKWDGWGTALKPSHELILVARKPLSGPNVASNILKWGCGGINVDGARIVTQENLVKRKAGYTDSPIYGTSKEMVKYEPNPQGRWPANFLLSHAEGCVRRGEKKVKQKSGSVSGKEPSHTGDENTVCYGEYERIPFKRYADPNGLETIEDWDCVEGCPVKLLDGQSGKLSTHGGGDRRSKGWFSDGGGNRRDNHKNDIGFASRFFKTFEYEPFYYCAKASRRERNEGLGEFAKTETQRYGKRHQGELAKQTSQNKIIEQNHHPTIKPVKLMRYLCRLVTPSNGVVLDPFMGSGSTGIACIEEGFGFIGIEKEREYFDIAEARIEFAKKIPKQKGFLIGDF